MNERVRANVTAVPVRELILVLGARNRPDGELEGNARARADTALHLFRARPGSAVILTGGRAPHFNISPRPHAGWVADYLIGLGMPTGGILGGVLSGNTVEDAIFAQELVATLRAERLVLVTSESHARRASLVFRCVFPQLTIELAACADALTPEELASRKAHETQAIDRLVHQGGILWHGRLLPLPLEP